MDLDGSAKRKAHGAKGCRPTGMTQSPTLR